MDAGMELAREADFFATFTREDCTKNLEFLPASPGVRAGRKQPLSLDVAKMGQRTSGE